MRTLRKKYNLFLHLQGLWYRVSGPFVYHPLVLVLVQELLEVSMISFRRVMAQLYGCSLLLQEPWLGYGSSDIAGFQQLDYYTITCSQGKRPQSKSLLLQIICHLLHPSPNFAACPLHIWSELNRKAI